jgi:hypothetical protein
MRAEIFAYCERGRDATFWAEPWNAWSNAAFVLAAGLAFAVWATRPVPDGARRGVVELGLIGLVAVIGVGSFLFHTFATRWAAIADVAPIGLFMLVYAGYALRRFLRLPWWGVAVGLAAFVATLQAAFAVPCPLALRGLVTGGRCLNGSLGYVPAFAMLAIVGGLALTVGSRAGGYLLAAAAVFAVSLTARTLDMEVCAATRLFGQLRGTHAIWHLLNATTLGLLLLAAVRHGTRDGRRTLTLPSFK